MTRQHQKELTTFLGKQLIKYNKKNDSKGKRTRSKAMSAVDATENMFTQTQIDAEITSLEDELFRDALNININTRYSKKKTVEKNLRRDKKKGFTESHRHTFSQGPSKTSLGARRLTSAVRAEQMAPRQKFSGTAFSVSSINSPTQESQYRQVAQGPIDS